jgi:hypothetical protein
MEDSGSSPCWRKGMNTRGIVTPRKVIKPPIHIKSPTMKISKDEEGKFFS